MKRKHAPLTLEQALHLLERYGSVQDPIVWNMTETTPEDLEEHMDSYRDAESVEIQFWGNPRYSKEFKIITGTLGDMVRERRRSMP